MVQSKIVVPTPSAVMVVTARVGSEITPEPEITDQAPKPEVGVFAAKVALGEFTQRVWLLPATDKGTTLSTIMDTVELLTAQTPFEMLHRKTFIPKPKFKAAVFANVGVTIVAVPDKTVHTPSPTRGMLPLRLVFGEEMQMDCVLPAFEISGTSSTWMLLVDVFVQAPFVSCHCKTLSPSPKLVTLLVCEFGLLNVPLPEIIDQLPIPVVGIFADNTVDGELTQSVWLGPATDVPGNPKTAIVNVEIGETHAPLVIVHRKTVLPTVSPVNPVVGDVSAVIVPLPESIDQVPTPTVGVFPVSVVLGELIQIL
jgi:hypothetical protein